MAKQGALVDTKGLRAVDASFRVVITGLKETDEQLAKIVSELRRQMYAEVGSMVKKRVTAARDSMPYDKRRKGRPKGKPHLRTMTYLTKSGSKRDIKGGRKQRLFGFAAISNVPHAAIMDLGKNFKNPALAAAVNKYGPAPRFLGRQLLPAGQGGTQMWRESKAIVDKYTSELQRIMDQNASQRVVSA